MNPISRLFILAMIALPAARMHALQQPQQPETTTPAPPTKTFKTSTRLVVVDVVATDKRGAPVHGLKREDFEVIEAGREQKLKYAEERRSETLYSAPAAAISRRPDGAVETTNRGQESQSTALSVILFDALNTASSDQSFAREQVKKTIAELPPGSRIAIFVLRGDLHMIQGFTTDTAALVAAMNKDKSSQSGPWFNDPDMTLLSQGVDPAATMSGSAPGSVASLSSTLSGNSTPGTTGPRSYLGSVGQRDEEGLTSQLRSARTFAAIAQLAHYLSVLPGRKNLFWLAGIFPFDLLPDVSSAPTPDPFRGVSIYSGPMHDLAVQMEAGHIAVYPVDVRGVADDSPFGAAGSARPGAAAFSASLGAQLSQQSVMEDIAHETGGRAIYNDNDIRGALIESLNQSGNYYSLAWSPEDKNWNGRYRKIEIRCARRDLHLDYRHGYLADDPQTAAGQVASDQVPKFAVAMVHGAPQRSEVVLSVTAAPSGKFTEESARPAPELHDRTLPFKTHLTGTTEKYNVAVQIDASTVTFTRDDTHRYVPHLALTFLDFDNDGKVLNAETGFFNQPLSEAQYQAVQLQGLTVTQQLEIPLGRSDLRIGVHDMTNDRVGATELPLVTSAPHK